MFMNFKILKLLDINNHAQRTWYWFSPLKGGGSLPPKKASWSCPLVSFKIWTAIALVCVQFFLGTLHISGSFPRLNQLYQHSNPGPKNGYPNRVCPLDTEIYWKPWLLFALWEYPWTSIWIPSAAHSISNECGLAGYSAQRPHSPVALKILEYNFLLLGQLHLSARGVDIWVPTYYDIGNAIVHVITF